MTLANAITLARIVLIPCFGYLWWRGHHTWALGVFAVASFSDWLDGFVARVLDQKTKLGQLLDPAADKLLMLVCFLVAAAIGAVPRWLAVLVIGRDLLLLFGAALFWFVLRGRYDPERWKPTRIGKYSTFVQVMTIGLALTVSMTGYQPLVPFLWAMSVHCAVLTVISLVQYVALGVRALLGDKLHAGGVA
jgi:cardiolipin synthase